MIEISLDKDPVRGRPLVIADHYDKGVPPSLTVVLYNSSVRPDLTIRLTVVVVSYNVPYGPPYGKALRKSWQVVLAGPYGHVLWHLEAKHYDPSQHWLKGPPEVRAV